MGFKIGDIVVALTSKDLQTFVNGNITTDILINRVKGQEFTVVGVSKCGECDAEMICIHETSLRKSLIMRCMDCGCTSKKSSHVWSMASNFRAKEFDPYEELSLAIKTENYERAAELRDIINADKK